MAMAGTAKETFEILLEQLRVDETFAAASDGNHIPARPERNRQDDSRVKAKFRDRIPSLPDDQKRSADQRRPEQTQRTFRQRTETQESVKTVRPDPARQP